MIKMLVAAAFIIGLSITAAALPPKELVTPEWPNSSVVALIDKNGDSYCSGFAAGNFIVTAGHCVIKPQEGNKIQFADGSTSTFSIAAASNPFLGLHDYAVLRPMVPSPAIEPINLACKTDIDIGDPVRIEGFPMDFGYTVSFGRVSNDALTPWNVWSQGILKVDAEAAPGNSGSPVILEETGQVIGILVGGLSKIDSFSAVQPIDVVCEVMNLG